jgi:hypothetical protein
LPVDLAARARSFRSRRGSKELCRRS